MAEPELPIPRGTATCPSGHTWHTLAVPRSDSEITVGTEVCPECGVMWERATVGYSMEDLRAYCELWGRSIFVRHQDATGKWGNAAYADMEPAEQERRLQDWNERLHVPLRIRCW